jgi:transposase
MRGNLGLFVCSADRARLAAIVADRNRAQQHVWRAQVVLLTSDRVGTAEIMRRTGLSKPSVWRWRERYIEAGVDGLLRDKTRPSRVPALAEAKVAEVIRRTLEEPPPGETTHWTVRAMARVTDVSPAKVHQIWQAAGLAPHRYRRFKLSNDPAFAAKVENVIGLYVDPPKHAIVLSVDEKSQGSPAIRAGSSTSRRPRAPGSTRSRLSLPSSPSGGSNAASSTRWSPCRRPSTASSRPTTAPPSRSSGRPIPTPSSPPPKEGTKR